MEIKLRPKEECTSMASLKEVEAIMGGAGARVKR